MHRAEALAGIGQGAGVGSRGAILSEGADCFLLDFGLARGALQKQRAPLSDHQATARSDPHPSASAATFPHKGKESPGGNADEARIRHVGRPRDS